MREVCDQQGAPPAIRQAFQATNAEECYRKITTPERKGSPKAGESSSDSFGDFINRVCYLLCLSRLCRGWLIRLHSLTEEPRPMAHSLGSRGGGPTPPATTILHLYLQQHLVSCRNAVRRVEFFILFYNLTAPLAWEGRRSFYTEIINIKYTEKNEKVLESFSCGLRPRHDERGFLAG